MAETNLAARLLAAAGTDPALRSDLSAAYGGRFDILDALWWRENPLTPTPGGHPDPAAELTDLQAAVYSRASDDEPVVDGTDPDTGAALRATRNELRLLEVRRQLSDDAAALDAVLERYSAWSTTNAVTNRGGTPNTTKTDASAAFADADELFPQRSGDARGEAGSEGTSRGDGGSGTRLASASARRTLALLAAGAAAGVLITLGVQAVQGPPAATEAAPGSQLIAEYNESNPPDQPDQPSEAESTSNVLRVFDRPGQFPTDQVPDLGSAYLPESIRSVFSAIPSIDGFGVYVAQRGVSQYCIIVQNADLTGSTECAGASVIAKYGLRLDATVLGRAPESTDGPLDTLLDLRVSWGQDGSFSGGTTRHIEP